MKVNYFYLLTACVVLSLCSTAQTTVCLIKGDSVLAGSTDKSRIRSVQAFNFVYNGPQDTSVTAMINKAAAGTGDLETFSHSSMLAVKSILVDYFSDILQKDPAFFDQQVVGNQGGRTVGAICFFGLEHNKPVLLNAVFYVNKGVRHPVVVSYSLNQQDIAVLSDGHHSRHRGIVGHLTDGGGVIEIKKMIGIDTDGPVDGSGPPIDVLVVTKNGRIWERH